MSRPVRVDQNLWAAAVAREGAPEWWLAYAGVKVSGELRVWALASHVLDPGSLIDRVLEL
jgi:hypothetical protein